MKINNKKQKSILKKQIENIDCLVCLLSIEIEIIDYLIFIFFTFATIGLLLLNLKIWGLI